MAEPEPVARLEALYSKTLALMSEWAVALLQASGDVGAQYLRLLGTLVSTWEANGVVLDVMQAQVVLDSLLLVFMGIAPKGIEIDLFEMGRQAGLAERAEGA